MKRPLAVSPCSQNIWLEDNLPPLPSSRPNSPCHFYSVQCPLILFWTLPPFTTLCPYFSLNLISSHSWYSPSIPPPHSTHGRFPSSVSSLSPPNLIIPHSSSCLPPLLSLPSTFPLPSVISLYIRAFYPPVPPSHTVWVCWEGDSPGETRD